METSGSNALPAGTLGFIDDGYTEKGYIAAVPGQYPALRFEFRRMAGDEAKAYHRELRRLGPDSDPFAIRGIGGKWLVKHLLAWDLKDAKGSVLPITEEFLTGSGGTRRKIKDELFARLLTIVGGMGPSDVDPLWTPAEEEAEIEAATNGLSPAENRERDEKN